MPASNFSANKLVPGSVGRNTRRVLLSTAGATAICGVLAGAASAEPPSVVASIKPLHSIASAVLGDLATPKLLVQGAASPHGFALKPSQAKDLSNADVVVWIGPELAPSLEKPISSLAENASVIEFMDVGGISHLDVREGGNFDAHDHDHGDHDDHDDHAHDDHDHEKHDHEEHTHDDHDHEKHDHEEQAHEEHAHDDHGHEEHDHEEHAHDDHDHHGKDGHIWLNPLNGKVMAARLADEFAKLDPDNAATYQANAAAFSAKIDTLDAEITAQLEPVKDGKFIVFHDAYHHFEHHYGIEAIGAITLNPEALAGADHLSEIRARIADLGVTCVFSEPQFESKLIDVVIEGSDVKVGQLDPLGAGLSDGPDLYPALLASTADSLTSCLSGE